MDQVDRPDPTRRTTDPFALIDLGIAIAAGLFLAILLLAVLA